MLALELPDTDRSATIAQAKEFINTSQKTMRIFMYLWAIPAAWFFILLPRFFNDMDSDFVPVTLPMNGTDTDYSDAFEANSKLKGYNSMYFSYAIPLSAIVFALVGLLTNFKICNTPKPPKTRILKIAWLFHTLSLFIQLATPAHNPPTDTVTVFRYSDDLNTTVGELTELPTVTGFDADSLFVDTIKIVFTLAAALTCLDQALYCAYYQATLRASYDELPPAQKQRPLSLPRAGEAPRDYDRYYDRKRLSSIIKRGDSEALRNALD